MAFRRHCDDPEIFFTAVQTGQSNIYIYTHNPTAKTKSVILRARNFPMMTGKKQDPSFK